MIDPTNDAINLMKIIDMGYMGGLAYDTAWVARIPRDKTTHKPMFPQTLLWLFTNQKEDGSWGSNVEYFHDRIISTLASIITLAKTHKSEKFKEAITKGEIYIWYNIKNLKNGEVEPVAFELLYPSLMKDAENIGLNLPYHEKLYREEREEKLMLGYSELLSKRQSTITFSLEHLGDNYQFERLSDIQFVNGSVGNSPAATAYILTKGYDQWAYNYLQKVMKFNYDSTMGLYPFEIFEIAWVLDNFILAGIPIKNHYQSYINYLKEQWSADGISMSRTYPTIDFDDTSVVFKLLSKLNNEMDPSIFIDYFYDDHFKCYKSERNPSMVVQFRVLDAIKNLTKFEFRDEYIDKILGFVKKHSSKDNYWIDKWNISPYYTTNIALRSFIDLDSELPEKVLNWILRSQNPNGSWGILNGTSEETAYALQALIQYHSTIEKIDTEILTSAVKFLLKNYSRENNPELWIGKALYSPKNVIKSAIISSLYMYHDKIQSLPDDN